MILKLPLPPEISSMIKTYQNTVIASNSGEFAKDVDDKVELIK